MGALEVRWDYAPCVMPNLVLRLGRDEPAHHFERTLGFQVAVQVPEQYGHQSQADEKPVRSKHFSTAIRI